MSFFSIWMKCDTDNWKKVCQNQILRIWKKKLTKKKYVIGYKSQIKIA